MVQRELRDSNRLALYTSIGCDLLHYEVNPADASILLKGFVSLPSTVQYVWPHTSSRYLYVACSFSRMNPEAPKHCLAVMEINPQAGQLTPHGSPVPLPERPIHLTTDNPSEHVLVAFGQPSRLRVFAIERDFTIGREIPQAAVTDKGTYGHQIRVTTDNRHAIFVTRGLSATALKPEEPGALKMFDYSQGVLSNEASIAPGGGFGFGPRHLDFHPTKPWVYVALERQNKLCMFHLENGRLRSEASYCCGTLAGPGAKGAHQIAGAIHVHPNGRFVYVANRADKANGPTDEESCIVGENNIAVYEVDQNTGEPKLAQHANTGKIYPRTFHIDPSGRLMFVQHSVPGKLRTPEGVQKAEPGLTVFRIGNDGLLCYERKYDLEGDKETMLWMGLVELR